MYIHDGSVNQLPWFIYGTISGMGANVAGVTLQ
jgi:hypothetical protein